MRALGAVVLAVLASGCAFELQNDLTEEEANEIYVVLWDRGVASQKVRAESSDGVRYAITVGRADVAKAAGILQKHALPRSKVQGLGVFKATKGMIPTQTEERAMFIEALGGEIANALRTIPGVVQAKVIVMIPEVNDLTQPDNKPLPSASVVIKYLVAKDTEAKVPFTDAQVKDFVARAVPDLKPDAISVLTAPVFDDELQKLSPPEQLSPQALKAIIGVLASLLLLSTGFIIASLLRKPRKSPAVSAPAPAE